MEQRLCPHGRRCRLLDQPGQDQPGRPLQQPGPVPLGPGAVASGNTVTVHFTSPAPYAAWQNYLWNQPILPQSAWSKLSATDQVTGANTSPVSSGPMTLVPGGYNQTEACYQDNPNWWGKTQLGLSFHFKYLCDVVNGSNNVELSALLSSNIDWSNNFLPGINTLMTIGGNNFIQTYYPSAPYMLSANTAWLELNTSKAPMNNVNFRRAVADAINPQNIVSGVYTGIVEGGQPGRPAAQPGQLPQPERRKEVRLQLQRGQSQGLPKGLRVTTARS